MKHITTILLATVAAAGLMSSAYAADLIIEEPMAEVGVVDVGGNWDGGFIGVFVGGGWGSADHEPAGGGIGNDIDDMAGWLVGVDAGFNFSVGSGLVVGIVGDIAWSNIEGSTTDINIGPYDEITHSIDWMGSLRGRVGFDGGAFLPYVTGGVAFAHGTRETFGPDDGPFTNTHVGWTVGAGVEFAATEELSVNLEYRYSDYGSEVYNDGGATVPEVSLTTHTVTAGLHWNF
jgi:outer membrane immunogenic protein